MLATIYASRLLQLHLIPFTLPISLNSLDLAGVRFLSPRDSPDTITTVAGADDTSADDATELKWEFDEERGRYYVSLPNDQWWSQVGTIGDLCSIWGSLLLFWFCSRTLSVIWMMDVYLCIV